MAGLGPPQIYNGGGYTPPPPLYPQGQTPNVNPTTAPGAPTFQPPAQPTDPRIDALVKQLQAQVGKPSSVATDPRIATLTQQLSTNNGQPDFSGIDAQTGDLKATLAKLLAGQGPAVGDLSNDPAAAAYKVTRQRQADQAREGEAARLGASGLTDSGDTQGRQAQLAESAGQDIAGFNANLTNQRRQEATQNATTGAQLQLSNLDQQRQEALAKTAGSRDLLTSLMAQDQLARSQEDTSQQSAQALLAQLIGQQETGTAQSQSAAAQAEALRQQNEQLRIQQQQYNKQAGGGGFPTGTRFGAFGGAYIPGVS